MRWLIDKEQKGCESIDCWIHIVNTNFDLTHDINLGFSRSNLEIAVSQDLEGWFTGNKRDVSWICHRMHNGIDLGPQCMFLKVIRQISGL